MPSSHISVGAAVCFDREDNIALADACNVIMNYVEPMALRPRMRRVHCTEQVVQPFWLSERRSNRLAERIEEVAGRLPEISVAIGTVWDVLSTRPDSIFSAHQIWVLTQERFVFSRVLLALSALVAGNALKKHYAVFTRDECEYLIGIYETVETIPMEIEYRHRAWQTSQCIIRDIYERSP